MIEFVKEIAFEAGEITIRRKQTSADIQLQFKNEKDLVTAVDREVEEYLVGQIMERFPDHGIYGEETGRANPEAEWQWIIDPIDGTTSFVHDQPFYSVSIGIEKNGELLMGCVRAPVLNETYWAEKGKGAWLGDMRIHVSKRDKLIHSVLSTGFACLRANWQENNLPAFCRIAPKVRGIRRYGSAAIDLAYVACGKLDGFWEQNLKPYDVAGGALLVAEAGGIVVDYDGGDSWPEKGTVATNGLIDQELRLLL